MSTVSEQSEDTLRYAVVRNDEEQYSIWLADRELPDGWHAVGFEGAEQECLDHIESVWTDMRPRSVREFLEELEASGALDVEPPDDPGEEDDLVDRLLTEQDVEARVRPEPTPQALQEAIERGYVHVLFSGTQGGTELGVELDGSACDTSAADFEAGTGEVTLEGTLALNFVPVRCHATLDVATLRGRGHLTREEA